MLKVSAIPFWILVLRISGYNSLYRAIDTYLKAHPSLSEHDRKRLCKVMNCKKLSLDACMHATQNERLPLRSVIQVLFSEQIKMREAMQGKEPANENDSILEQEAGQTSTASEIKTLKAELEQVKAQMMELQHDYSELQHDYEKRSRTLSGGVEIIGGKQRSNSAGRNGKRLSMSSPHQTSHNQMLIRLPVSSSLYSFKFYYFLHTNYTRTLFPRTYIYLSIYPSI